MLYVLRPLRAPNTSHWNNNGILCGNNNSNNNEQTDRPISWNEDNKQRPRRVRLRSLQIVNRNDDENRTGIEQDEVDANRNPKSLSECYFAGKGTALVLPDAEAHNSTSRRTGAQGGSSNIQKHLQSMFYLLRPEETLKMAVKLESVHPSRTRYLVVVSRMGTRSEESCLLGIDCNEKTTVGLVLKVLADTQITLDGDGGFSVSVCDRHHIFKPVSVQAMWSALQTLHKVSAKAREQTYFEGGMTHGWVNYYENRIESDRSCLNEWHAMDNLESKRPPSPDSIRTKPTEREETEKVIRTTLKEIMMSVDLDEVTSKVIRSRLEEELDMDLGEYKSFIDQEILVILGQMDAPTEIFEHVYLGSEWNASNYEELTRNGVGHILNVTREIDNFFPGTFDYLNIRVYDDEKTDLLKHWDDTFKYITKAKDKGSKVLVHCKMGVSRSASVVIAYAMKAYNWDFTTALKHVKEKRSCIKPNTSFLTQLETYQGILDAMKNKEKLQRSKSETNLIKTITINDKQIQQQINETNHKIVNDLNVKASGDELKQNGVRPKSWSPDNLIANDFFNVTKSSTFLSLEDLSQKSTSKESIKSVQDIKIINGRHVLMPCDNGESYSVSPNQIVLLPNEDDRIYCNNKKKFVLELTTKFEEETNCSTNTWDPGEQQHQQQQQQQLNNEINHNKSTINDDCDIGCVWTSSTTIKNVLNNSEVPSSQRNLSDPFSNQLDRVFDREEKRKYDNNSLRPSRQSSWSSYDSALGGANEMLSRHSSWGSGDNTRTLPSRNSSWGSYDMRQRGPVHYCNEKGEKIQHNDDCSSSGIFAYDKEDIPWLAGTVKRTKQKIEEKKTDAIDIPLEKSNSISRLSISAPVCSTMDLIQQQNCQQLSRSVSNIMKDENCSSIVKSFLENLQQTQQTTTKKLDNNNENSSSSSSNSSSGKVRNLKKEFEAKNLDEQRVNSLPSSPVSLHHDKIKSNDDMNLKSLIGIFENQNDRKDVNLRKKNVTKARNLRHSCIEVSVGSPVRIIQTPLITSLNRNDKNDGDFNKRPPIVPVVRTTSPRLMVAATVIATAAAKNAKKQQQYGKSHPLAQLNIKPRHNNPVYNTM